MWVLDQSPVREGGSAQEALNETIKLASIVEDLGYERFWVAEHHNLPGFAGTSPEIMVGQLASRTRTIRVGSGGVMLTHYSSLKVAENFRLLESLFPGRIDLGLGRAPGSDQRTAAALAYPGRTRDAAHYPEQVGDLLAYLGDTHEVAHPFSKVKAGPTLLSLPEVWLLGSGFDSAHLAAELGLPFSFAQFFGTAAEEGPAIASYYREHFRPSRYNKEPCLNVTVQVICADTDDEAEYLSSSLGLMRLQLALGRPGPIVSPDTALAHPYNEQERAFVDSYKIRNVIGGPAKVNEKLRAIADAYQTDILGVVTVCHNFDARIRSYELVAGQIVASS